MGKMLVNGPEWQKLTRKIFLAVGIAYADQPQTLKGSYVLSTGGTLISASAAAHCRATCQLV